MIVDAELPVILARACIHPMRASQLQELAVQLIEAGLEAPELHDIAWDSVIDTVSAQHLLDAALPKLSWRHPSRKEAVAILLHHYSTAVAHYGADLLDTFEAMSRDAIYPEMCAHESSSLAGDTHDMAALVQDHYVFDDLMERSADAAEMAEFLTCLRRDIADRLSRHVTVPSLKVG